MPKKIELIYENESDGLWFWIKTKWNQLFRRSNEKNNPVSAATSELEYLSNNWFDNINMSDKYKEVFKNYLPNEDKEIENEENKEFSIKDISDIAESIKPKKKDANNPNNFYDKISEPLKRAYLIKANALEYGEEEQAEYEKACFDLIESADQYINTHDPYTKEGKARVDFAVRLKFMMKEELGISRNSEDDVLDEEIENRERIEVEEAKNYPQLNEDLVKGEEPAKEKENDIVNENNIQNEL